MQSLAVCVSNDVRSELTVTLKQAHNSNLARSASAYASTVTNAAVHIAGKTSNVRLIDFYVALKLFCKRSSLHRETDTLKHEPCGLLRDPDSATNFIRAYAVLAVGDHPDRHQPLIQAKRRVLENGSNLNRELSALMRALTLPLLLLRQKRHVSASARWADNTIGPAASN
jgi:hypothetical protein